MSEPLNWQGKGRSLEQRIFDYCIPEPNSGCWLWLGGLNACGYGTIGVKYKSQLAHRVSYKVFRGKFPKHKCILHHCDMPCCVNPDHLFVGTPADNVADMENKKRSYHPRGEAHGRAKLTAANVRAIRLDTRSQRVVGDAYGVSHAMIGYIRRGKTWGHVQ